LLGAVAAARRLEGEDADTVPRRRAGSARPDGPVDRDAPRAKEPRRADAPLRGAARAAWLHRAPASAVQGERGAGLVRAVGDRADLHLGDGSGPRSGRRPGALTRAGRPAVVDAR